GCRHSWARSSAQYRQLWREPRTTTAIWTRLSSSSLVRMRETVALTVAALTRPGAGAGRWLDPSVAWHHLAGGTMTATTWAPGRDHGRGVDRPAGAGGRLACPAPPGRR